MNHLGILLAWSALQTTLLALTATAAYLIAANRKPTVGAMVAAAGPCGAVILTLLAVSPLPSWWNWQPPCSAATGTLEAMHTDLPPNVEPSSSDVDNATPTAPSSGGAGLAWPVALGWWTWEGAGRASAPFTDQSGNGWEIAAIVFLIGVTLCGFRLAYGLWAVADLRRRSRPVSDSSICLLMDQLRKEMGYRSRVEVRESSSIGAPAVVGSLRPMVLLPADWREWSDTECRAVLAHELAHVRRADYLLGLLVRFGVALHFYHPLLYWLAGRLRLQQELAADALAAPFAGGRGPYLLALAGLALRLEDRRSAGWPANPMFSPGTLMRRIHMLKIKDGRSSKPVSRWGRALIVAVLAIAVVGVSALRCPAQKTAEAKPNGESNKEVVKSPRGEGLEAEPFDLSYLHPDAMGAVAFRPAAVFGRPGLKKYADAFREMVDPAEAFGLSIEEIAQVSATVKIGTTKPSGEITTVKSVKVTTENGKKAEVIQNTLMFGMPAMIRAVKDFDWGKELKALIPGVMETRHGGKVVYKLPTDGPLAPLFGGAKPCFFTPDARTVVFDTEEGLARIIDRKSGGDAPAWAADWKRVDRGIAAVVLDDRDGRINPELAARDNPEPSLAPFQEHTSWALVGVSTDQDFVCDAAAHFDSEEIAGKAVQAINGGLAAARGFLAAQGTLQLAGDDNSGNPDAAESIMNARLTAFQFLKALVHEPDLKRDGATVRLRCRAKCDITEVLKAILGGELGL
jgi:beta-lactamase regulating signal transducer with metallopeptidase domain